MYSRTSISGTTLSGRKPEDAFFSRLTRFTGMLFSLPLIEFKLYAGSTRHKWRAIARRAARGSARADPKTVSPSSADCEGGSLTSSNSEDGGKKKK
jgi:hypothetical protein